MKLPTEDKTLYSEVSNIGEEIAWIEDQWVIHDLENDQLKHMYTVYKADILALQEKIQRQKENIRKGKLRQDSLMKEYNYFRK